ncbi:MAG: hypothetical protein UE295_08355 [Acutalibacteraceae bacterium]|nr:hypothetical protein [Acutalibacteraceae bacterium]
MKFSNYLIGFGIGDITEENPDGMLQTENGKFTQKTGCHITTITFTVQKAGEIEVFTRLENAMRDNDRGIKARYVAVNSKVHKPEGDLSDDDKKSDDKDSDDKTQKEEEPESIRDMQIILLGLEDKQKKSDDEEESDDKKSDDKKEPVERDLNNDGSYTLGDIIIACKNKQSSESKNKDK